MIALQSTLVTVHGKMLYDHVLGEFSAKKATDVRKLIEKSSSL